MEIDYKRGALNAKHQIMKDGISKYFNTGVRFGFFDSDENLIDILDGIINDLTKYVKYYCYICDIKIKIMKIQLVDLNPEMVNAWKHEFHNYEDVSIHLDDFFAVETDCIVSPANSFGFMNGGLDGVITKRLGRQVESNVQNYIKELYLKELLVGQATIVETDNDKIPYCISAPTMRTAGSDISNTLNVYLASKAIFTVLKTIQIEDYTMINTVNISGLGTGVGGMYPEICAFQMKQAYIEVWKGKGYFPKSSSSAKLRHEQLISGIL